MEILDFLKEYWFFITFIAGLIIAFSKFSISMVEATKCTLRNDILDIYDRCKVDKKITHYELEAVNHSAEVYFKLKGNSFVHDVVNRVQQFELID